MTDSLREYGPSRFLNRELSWLEFNRRVLALAGDGQLPLLERVKFVAIFSTNLDEFFQVRVAGLHAQLRAQVGSVSPDGLSIQEQCAAIHASVGELATRQHELLQKELAPALAEQGIRVTPWDQLGKSEQEYLRTIFEEQIAPVLTPLAVDPAHPFPAISNLSLNLAVIVEDPETNERHFARLKVPNGLPRFWALPDGEQFVPIEQVIGAHLGGLFPGMEISASYPFRVTLDADLEYDEGEADDLREAIASGLHRRIRINAAARLEIDDSMSPDIQELLVRELSLGPHDVYRIDGLLDLSGVWQLYRMDRPDLKDDPWTPVTPRGLRADEGRRSGWFFDVLRSGDVLVHHPYDSFAASVEEFVWQAARDPRVRAIKHTLYRMSGADNPVVLALCHAARSGKEVVALIELKARFDEQANIERARLLEESGVHVGYGIVGLKTHAKIVLVVREDRDGIRRYCHLGTGNYNPDTARLYEDIGLFTASSEIGADVAALFNYLTGYARAPACSKLLVAPHSLRSRLIELIEDEMKAGDDGEIALKLNSLSDPGVIDALYAASCAGVRVDLVVRGICTLRPGVLGLSENVRVHSVLGRFLEHSRIFRFGSEARGRRYLIGSADLMTRKLDHRVEAMVPVEQEDLKQRIDQMLEVVLDARAKSWELDQDGVWTRGGEETPQERFQELARERSP